MQDAAVLAAFWLKDELLADIYPQPFGDGTIDFKDLALFAAYWNQ